MLRGATRQVGGVSKAAKLVSRIKIPVFSKQLCSQISITYKDPCVLKAIAVESIIKKS